MKPTIHQTGADQKGFTLIEIMVVVVILGILAGLVVPKLLGRDEQARQTQARVQIKSLEEALALFKLDNGFFPDTDQGLEALVSPPGVGRQPANYRKGGYVRKVPNDPWGNAYSYFSPGEHGDYDLSSYGADGVAGGTDYNADINNWELD